MLPPRHILVATDFSEPSAAALRYGRELARAFHARLHVLHAVDHVAERSSQDPADTLPLEVEADIRNAAQNELERLLTSDDRQQLAAVAELRMSSMPASCIVDYARASTIDLIVMGTHGRGGLVHRLLGSVADRVVRTAPCPVLVVPHLDRDDDGRALRASEAAYGNH
jgi:nucleotide-binding universal stress UspA family protein